MSFSSLELFAGAGGLALGGALAGLRHRALGVVMLQALRSAGAALLVLLNGDKHVMVRPCCSLAVGCWWRRVLVSLGRSWGYRSATLVRAL